MSIFRVLLKELRFRWLNSLLALTAVAAAVTLFVAILTLSDASERETARLMREVGFNLIIIPKDTDMDNFWATDCADKDMPESYVERLLNAPGLHARHYVATLRRRVTWQGQQILLTGVRPEAESGKNGSPAQRLQVRRGTAVLGYELWHGHGLSVGDTIEVLGTRLTVARCLNESASKDDISLYVHLRDAQTMLGKPGRINMIQALGRIGSRQDLAHLRIQLAQALPEAKVTRFHTLSRVRAQTDEMVEKYGRLVLLAVLVACAGWIGLLSFLNVRERQQEIGVLRALGFPSGRLAALFLGRAVLVGVAGAVVGFVAGSAVALRLGPGVFRLVQSNLTPLYSLLGWSLLLAPLTAAVAALLPALAAVRLDPAVTLVRE